MSFSTISYGNGKRGQAVVWSIAFRYEVFIESHPCTYDKGAIHTKIIYRRKGGTSNVRTANL